MPCARPAASKVHSRARAIWSTSTPPLKRALQPWPDGFSAPTWHERPRTKSRRTAPAGRQRISSTPAGPPVRLHAARLGRAHGRPGRRRRRCGLALAPGLNSSAVAAARGDARPRGVPGEAGHLPASRRTPAGGGGGWALIVDHGDARARRPHAGGCARHRHPRPAGRDRPAPASISPALTSGMPPSGRSARATSPCRLGATTRTRRSRQTRRPGNAIDAALARLIEPINGQVVPRFGSGATESEPPGPGQLPGRHDSGSDPCRAGRRAASIFHPPGRTA